MLMSAIRNHPRMYIGGTNIKLYGWCLIVLLTLIPISISIYLYIYMFTPHQGLFFLFFLLHWLFHYEVNRLLSAICLKNNALESLLPFPHPQVSLPICFFCFRSFFPWYPSPSKTQPKTSHPKCLYVYFFWCGGKVAARFLRFCGFSSCILWKLSKAMSSYCDVLFTQSKPNPEKNTRSPAKCTTSEQWSVLV